MCGIAFNKIQQRTRKTRVPYLKEIIMKKVEIADYLLKAVRLCELLSNPNADIKGLRGERLSPV